MSPLSASTVATQAAARLNLKSGRDGVLRGKCPCCAYSKPTVRAVSPERWHRRLLCRLRQCRPASQPSRVSRRSC